MKKLSNQQIILLLVILLFLALKIPQIDFKYGDENIYFYMGQLVAQGQLPYFDFFFASPPLQILLIAFLILIFGLNVFLLKLIPLLCVISSGVLIYLILKHQKKELAGLFTCVFYPFSFLVLTTSDYFSGIHLTVFLCLLSIYALVKNKPGWAGTISALALLTRFYAVPIVLAIVIYILITKRTYFWKFVLSSGLVFVSANLILYLIFRQNYWQDVFIYHFLKFEELDKSKVFNFFLRWDWVLLVFSGLSFFIVRWKKMILPLIAVVLGGAFLFFFKDIYYLYFNLILPFLAILASLALIEMLRVWSWSSKGVYISLVIVVVFLLLLSGYNVYYYLQEHAPAARIDYIQDLNQFILKNSNPQDKIYGSFEITPLIAGMTGRKIVGNFIDTNNKTFSTGMFDLSQREKVLSQEKVKFIITKVLVDQDGYLLELGRFISLDFLQNNCEIVKRYPIKKDYYSNLLLVWECF